MGVFEKYSFESEVWHASEPNPGGGEDLVQIKIRVYIKVGATTEIDSPLVYSEPYRSWKKFDIDNLSRGELLSNRSEYTWRMVQFLSGEFGDQQRVPEDVRRSSIEELFRVAEEDLEASSSSFSVIYIDILEVCDYFCESAAAALLDDAISSIKGLEKVRVDSCLEELEETPSCVICTEQLIDGGGKKRRRKCRTIAKKPRRARASRVVTRLPCSHHFHGDCIVRWLKINRVCPLCRYQVAQPSKRTLTLASDVN